MTKSVINNPAKLNTALRYGILEIGEGSRKLSGDFLYLFADKLDLKETVCLKEGESQLPDGYDSFICCTQNREEAGKKLSSMGLTYKKNYYWAEDFFCLLDDWKQKKIAFLSYPGTLKSRLKSIAFGYVAKKGKTTPKKGMCLFYAWNLIGGLFAAFPQAFAKGNAYQRYDLLCFESVCDAVRFKKDFPSAAGKVITVEELKAHTMASSYMLETYRDKRQNDCGCLMPFQTLWVGIAGTTRLCDCPYLLDISCGNVGVTDINEIWNSPLAKIIRLSVINNTYTFCSREQCAKLFGGREHESLLERKNIKTAKQPLNIDVGNDRVCNLHCASCRNAIYAKNDEDTQAEVNACTNAILDSGWLENANEVVVGADGETFLSNSYKKILSEGPLKGKNVVIMTNGTLFTPKVWSNLEGKCEHLAFLVSIDASTKETYEKLRRGGNFERLMENMDFLSRLRREGKVERVKVIMVVQNANYREIPDFIRWAKEKGFDGVNLSGIRNWGTYRDDFFWQNVSMFGQNGQMKPELKAVLEDPVCDDPIVNCSWK